MMPKSGVFKNSEVFQVINDEQLKTKEQLEAEENKAWTTFLQKPNRPAPRPRNEEPAVEGYKPFIVKQSKPRCAPDFCSTPTPEPEEPEQELPQEPEQPMPELIEQWVSEVVTQATQIAEECTSFDELIEEQNIAAEEAKKAEENMQNDDTSVVSSAFAEQLYNVQNQLLALSHLPKTIQSTLDEITKQIQQLIPPGKFKMVVQEEETTVETATTGELFI